MPPRKSPEMNLIGKYASPVVFGIGLEKLEKLLSIRVDLLTAVSEWMVKSPSLLVYLDLDPPKYLSNNGRVDPCAVFFGGTPRLPRLPTLPRLPSNLFH